MTTLRMKARRKQKLARMETQMDYNSADEAQDSDKMLSKDETITKLSQLEKLYEEKKKVYYAVLSVIVLCGTLY